MSLPTPPWEVAGCRVGMAKDSSRKELTITVTRGAFDDLTDDALLEVLNFIEELAERFRKVLPPEWKVIT